MAKTNFNGYKYHRKLITYTLVGETKPQTKRIYGKTLELLEVKEKEKLDEIAKENQRRTAGIKSLTTVGHQFAEWLERYKGAKKKTNTYQNYEMYMNNWIIAQIGNLQTTEVTTDNIQDLLNAMLLKGKKLQTQKHVYLLLKEFFQWAMNRRLINSNPVVSIEKPKPEKPNPNPPTKAEVDAILKEVKDKGTDINYLFFSIAAKTGMRRSEVAGLSVENYDSAKRILFVRRAIVDVTPYGKEQVYQIFDKMKTTQSTRDVSIGKSLAKDIDDYIASKNLKKHKDGYTYLFQETETGLPIHPNTFSSNYFSLVRRLHKRGLVSKVIGIKNLRHYHATTLRDKGYAPHQIAKRLGHSLVSTTELYYIKPNLSNGENDGIGDEFN